MCVNSFIMCLTHRKEARIMKNKILENIDLTDDTLKNIMLMVPHLNEVDRGKVVGLIFGLLSKGE